MDASAISRNEIARAGVGGAEEIIRRVTEEYSRGEIAQDVSSREVGANQIALDDVAGRA